VTVAPLGDPHQAFFELVRRHAASIGRRLRTVAWLEDKTWTTGITEAPYILGALEARGVQAFIADPRDFALRGDEVTWDGRPVDVVYRNIELRDIAAMERGRSRLEGMRALFRRNQVVSSLAGDLDHKSLLEVLCLPEVLRRLSPGERRTVRAVVPWTRLVREARTQGPTAAPWTCRRSSAGIAPAW